jgi:peptidylprolyl isomerase
MSARPRSSQALFATLLALLAALSACADDEPCFRPARSAAEGAGPDSASTAALDSDDLPAPRSRRVAPITTPVPAPADVAGPPPDAERSESGLAWRVLREGRGRERPGPRDLVTLHYTGWMADGTNFDASARTGEPATFALPRTIAGWREALMQMRAGERRRLWVPPHLAYEGRPGQPQGMLVFDLELIAITPMPPEVPEDLTPPPDAARSPSGLAWRVLRRGGGWTRPSERSGVRVHYAAWTADGRLFESTFERGEASHVRLDSMIAGWAEGVRGMVEGERRRLWIPAHLGFTDGGGPPGPLVFDVELVEILD